MNKTTVGMTGGEYLSSRNQAILIGIVVVCAAARLKYAYLRASIPFQMDYEEGNILNAAVRLLDGKTPYPVPGSFPYVLNPYGPIGYILSAVAVRTFGLSLFGPRFFVLAAGVGIAILISFLANYCGVKRSVTFVFGTLFLCSPLMWKWFPLLRVDLWAIFLSLLGLYLFLRWPRSWPVAAFVFALALLTKHTALAAPSACVAELLFERKRYRAVVFTALIGGITALGIVSLGGAPIFHLFKTHPDPYLIARSLGFYWVAIEGSFFVLAIIIYSLAFRFRFAPQSTLVWLYFALCSATALTAGKLGSETNHFLEWTAVVCLVGSLSISHLLETRVPLAETFLVGITVLTTVFAFLPPRLLARSLQQEGCQEAYTFVHSSSGEKILSEDVSALVLNGKPVLVSNPFLVTQLGNSVAWSRGSLNFLVDEQYFDLIALEGKPGTVSAPGRWEPLLMKEVSEHYKLERDFQCSTLSSVFVPK